MPDITHWVLKLGGSLLGAAELPAWLDIALGAGAGRVVIVPGGGPFADTVRETQSLLGFGAQAAHDMALLAMAQTGHLLMDLRPALQPAADAAAARRVLASGACAVWLPDPLALRAETDIAVGWDVTSDSLAAWLAGRMRARGLALVKSAPAASLRGDLPALVAAGVLDREFTRHAHASQAQITLFARDEQRRFAALLAGH